MMKFFQTVLLGILMSVVGCTYYPASYTVGIKASDPRDKVKLFTECIESEELDNKQKVVVYERRSNAYIAMKDYQSAADDMGAMIAINPELTNAYFNRASHLTKVGDYDQAVRDYEVVINRNPDDFEAWLKLGRVYKKKKAYVMAVRAFNKALEIKPDYIQAYLSRADSLMRLNRREETIREYSFLMEQFPDNALYQYLRGRAFVFLGEYAEAERDFKSSIAGSSNKAEVYSDIAAVYKKNKMYKQAVDNYENALKENPNRLETLQYYSWFLARNDKVKNSQRALELANKAIDITDGKDPHSYEVLAAAYAASKDYDNAIVAQQKAILIHVGLLFSGIYHDEETMQGLADRLTFYRKGLQPPE